MSYILIAEDDRDILLMMQRKLQLAGYANLWTTGSGQEALERTLSERPLLLILDVTLPEVNGFEICRQVKAHYSDQAPPVIVTTARGRMEDRAEGEAAGVDHYVVKPYSPRELTELVRQLLR